MRFTGYTDKKRTYTKTQKALDRMNQNIEKHKKNNTIAGPFYKNGCIIWCSKNRLEEVKEKFNISNDDPIKRLDPFKRKQNAKGYIKGYIKKEKVKGMWTHTKK
jgi:phosphotransacetylase